MSAESSNETIDARTHIAFCFPLLRGDSDGYRIFASSGKSVGDSRWMLVGPSKTDEKVQLEDLLR
jgi:hypothetical protein